MLGMAVLAGLGATCSREQESCPCPSGGARITLPADQQSMITKVTGDRCQSASNDPTQGIFLFASAAGTCHVRIELANGEVLTAQVTFKPVGGCCPDTYSGEGSTPVQVDGGAGD